MKYMGVSERQRKDKEGFSRATIEGSLLSDIRESKGQEKGEMERERERENMLVNWTTKGEREEVHQRERRPRRRAEKTTGCSFRC